MKVKNRDLKIDRICKSIYLWVFPTVNCVIGVDGEREEIQSNARIYRHGSLCFTVTQKPVLVATYEMHQNRTVEIADEKMQLARKSSTPHTLSGP